jgi:hypothetical protein
MNKKEKEIVADIRNKFTPLLNYFTMKEDLDKTDLPPGQKADLDKIIEDENKIAQTNVKIIAKQLKALG